MQKRANVSVRRTLNVSLLIIATQLVGLLVMLAFMLPAIYALAVTALVTFGWLWWEHRSEQTELQAARKVISTARVVSGQLARHGKVVDFGIEDGLERDLAAYDQVAKA